MSDFRNSSPFRSSRRTETVKLCVALGVVGVTALASGGAVFYGATKIHGPLSLIVFGFVPIAAAVDVATSATIFHRWL